MKVRALVLLAAVLPFTASAAKIVPGFTEVTVGERGTISVSMTLLGPAKGPLKVGLVNGKRLNRAVDLELIELPAGKFISVMADLRVGKTATGTHTIGIEGPKGIIARTQVTIVPGPKQEMLGGRKSKSKTIETFIHKRDSDLRRGFIDDTGDGLVVVFFLKVAEIGEDYQVDFKHKKKRVCGDVVSPAGFKGQVVQVRASCRPGEAGEAENSGGGDVLIDDAADMSKPITLGSAEPLPGEGDIVVDDGESENVMPLAEILEKPGFWKVEVKKGEKLKRVLTFSVKRKKVMPGLPGKAPLKLAKVKVLSP